MPHRDPYMNFKFLVEIDNIIQAGFSECSGFGSEVTPVDYREGGDNDTVLKYRGLVTYPDISLRWGQSNSRELYDWHLKAVQGTIERKTGSIILLDSLGQEAVRWNFFGAWPTKWDGPELNGTSNDVAITTLTLTCEKLEQAAG